MKYELEEWTEPISFYGSLCVCVYSQENACTLSAPHCFVHQPVWEKEKWGINDKQKDMNIRNLSWLQLRSWSTTTTGCRATTTWPWVLLTSSITTTNMKHKTPTEIYRLQTWDIGTLLSNPGSAYFDVMKPLSTTSSGTDLHIPDFWWSHHGTLILTLNYTRVLLKSTIWPLSLPSSPYFHWPLQYFWAIFTDIYKFQIFKTW